MLLLVSGTASFLSDNNIASGPVRLFGRQTRMLQCFGPLRYLLQDKKIMYKLIYWSDCFSRTRNFCRPNFVILIVFNYVNRVCIKLTLGNHQNYDMERGFSRHPIDEAGDKGTN